MPTYPASQFLVPATPPTLPDDFQVVQSRMVNGLPHLLDVTKTLRLKVTLPTGLLQDWLDADPSTLVATSDDELAPQSATLSEEVGGVSRPAPRITAQQSGTPVATAPFALYARRTFRDDGAASQGSLLEVAFLEWKIYAGTVRGVGDFGSYIKFAWRPATLAVSDFGPPVINPFLRLRLLPILWFERSKILTEKDLLLLPCLESEQGLRKVELDVRFAARKEALR